MSSHTHKELFHVCHSTRGMTCICQLVAGELSPARQPWRCSRYCAMFEVEVCQVWAAHTMGNQLTVLDVSWCGLLGLWLVWYILWKNWKLA